MPDDLIRPFITKRLASARMLLKDLPNQRSTTKESEVPTRINVVDRVDQIEPALPSEEKRVLCSERCLAKAEIRASMPFDFCIGTSRVIASVQSRLRNRTFAMLAAIISSLWTPGPTEAGEERWRH
jgi:hypothetical protein